MSDNADVLNRFGQLVVQYVRDAIIAGTDRALAGDRRDIYAQHIYTLAANLPSESQIFVQQFVPYLIDTTIAVFLQLLDQEPETLRIQVRQEDGTYTNLLELTDSLEAEYHAMGGWAETFSIQRPDTIRIAAEKQFEDLQNKAE